ncbi:hypothetical protein GGR56DRAFT_64883 [Xylariaceae sp. FL0804]|nr:hypothetical protein GGR56DRAFT_64883 [Xylariaceae sp. FL0804]
MEESTGTNDGHQSPAANEDERKFVYFGRLPAELRAMIWRRAVRGQDRYVITRGFRRINWAPCPPLFLVCHESLQVVQKLYQRVRGGDLLYGSIKPAFMPYAGPVLSFEHDIFSLYGFSSWVTPGCNSPQEAYRHHQLSAGPLRPICGKIEEFSGRRIKRVAVSGQRMAEKVWFENGPLTHDEAQHV